MLDKQLCLNEYARSLRDTADNDYLAARLCYQHQLFPQFLWSGQQALEKYLKSILLYNSQSAKDIGHNLRKGLARVIQIADLQISVPAHIERTIGYFSDYGGNRYIDGSYFISPHVRSELDAAVWFVRRYCQFLRLETPGWRGGASLLPARLAEINSPRLNDRPYEFLITGGALERMRSDDAEKAEVLCSRNRFFAAPDDRGPPSVVHSVSVNPLQIQFPEAVFILEKYVQIDKELVSYLKKRAVIEFSSSLEESTGARVSIGAIRTHFGWPEENVDAVLLLLAKEGAVSLLPPLDAASMPPSEIEKLVRDSTGAACSDLVIEPAAAPYRS